jgi:phospholipid/cholesterol/gamma-HCH transport system substrate-binding protein
MRNRRIYLNLGFFVALGIVMTIWAFTTIIKLDAITKPYRVSAEFVTSPGLIQGFDVAYLGVQVGKIGDVRLAIGKVVVGLDIDKEIRLPRSVTAAVRRKSAVGEPYVELSPPKTGVGGPSLAAGDVIPLSKTTVPIDYKKLFDSVGKLLNAVSPEDARTITHELATALDGRSSSISGIIDDAHDLTGTLADNAQLLDDLSVQLTLLTHTLAGHKDALAAGITDLATVTGTLRESRADLNAFLDQGPGVFGRLDQAIKAARPGFSCLLTALGLPHKPVFSAETEKNVHHLLSLIPTALSLADDLGDRQGDTTYGRTEFLFSVPGGPTPAEEYAGPAEPPVVPALRACPAHAPADTAGHADPGRAKEAAGQPTDDPAALTTSTTRPDSRADARPEETRKATDGATPAAAAGPASGTPRDPAPLIVAIFLAVVAGGGIVGWIAAGRAARRREESR